MKKYFLLFSIIFSQVLLSQPEFSKISSMPGAFSRMGFGARGIGMGNAMSSVIEGNLVSYYNPALSAFQESNSAQTSYTFLSLDRSLNFLNFTRRFDFYSAKDSVDKNRKPRSSAGVSIGIINSGVSNIDGRDNQGFKTEELSTSENQFFLGLANRFSDKLALGVAIKIYYYKLYEEVSSSGLGIDLGLLYRIGDEWNLSFVITDINSKYKWDTAPIYGQEGRNTEDKFPNLRKLGISYSNKSSGILGSIEYENSNAQSNVLRAGVEYNLIEMFFVRGGIDHLNLSNTDVPIKPAFGFSYFKMFSEIKIGIDYAFMLEQYSSSDRHVIGVNINF